MYNILVFYKIIFYDKEVEFMEKIKYIGCFFDLAEVHSQIAQLGKERLYKTIENPHITFKYRPDSVPEELFGLPVRVKVIGYGRDEENEALLVEFSELPEALIPLTEEISVPHITLSIAADGKSVNSRALTFFPIKSFYLEGVFGGMEESGKKHTI